MAIVISPTCTSARAPSGRGFRSVALSSARMTAVSMDLSTATTAPETLVPSWSRSVTVSDRPTTCEAVRMRPPSAATKPEPTAPSASICTTEGRSLSAMSASGSPFGGSTAPPLSAAPGPPAAAASSVPIGLPVASRPVPTRTTAATRRAAPMTSRRRGRLEAAAAGIGDATGRRGRERRGGGPDERWGRRQVAPAAVLTIVAGEGVVHGSGPPDRYGRMPGRTDAGPASDPEARK